MYKQIKINFRLGGLQKELFAKYYLCRILETNNAFITKTDLVIHIIKESIGENAKQEKPVTFHANKRMVAELEFKLDLDVIDSVQPEEIKFQISLDTNTYKLLELYRHWHIVETEETYITTGNLIKRLVIRYIYNYFTKAKIAEISTENLSKKVDEIKNEVRKLI